MFQRLILNGTAAELLWGYRTAVVLGRWKIGRVKGEWTLRAAVTRIDPLPARQRPLLFTAPRPGGFWAWPIDTIELGPTTLEAKLGPPVR